MSDMVFEAEDWTTVRRLYEQIRPMFAGQDPHIVGFVLADLTATWLAGHVIEGDNDATERMRAKLLRNNMGTTMALVGINARMIGTDLLAVRPEGKA